MGKVREKRKWMFLAFVFAAPFIGAVSLYFLVINSDIQEELKESTESEVEEVRNYNEQLTTDTPPAEFATFAQEDLQTAMDVATEFALRFHAIDQENPFKYVEDAKPYMTDEMYEAYKDIPKRATLAAVEERVMGVEIWPHNLVKGYQTYQVDVYSESISIDGEVNPSVTSYLINLKEQAGEWKVDGVNVNGG